MRVTNDKTVESGHNTQQLAPPKTFTGREQKILELLSMGYDTKQIAQALYISPHTVNTHRKNIINKTDTMDTTAAVAYAKLINVIR